MGDDAAGHKAEARDGCCAYVRTFVLFFFRPPPLTCGPPNRQAARAILPLPTLSTGI